MIFYLVKTEHSRTMAYPASWGPTAGSRMQFLFYEDLANRGYVSPGTYIFADLETLSPGELTLAEELCQQLARAGKRARILNNPFHALRRFELLCKLYEAGTNSFRVFRGGASLENIRFPVFIRREDDHRGSLTDLLYSRNQLDRMLMYLRLQGHRLLDLLIVEFCNTANGCGVFRKYSAFFVGNQVLPRHVIFGRSWKLKQPELTTDDLRKEQLEYLETNPHEKFVTEIFQRANIDYGRIDYSMVKSGHQVWEINTHPTVRKLTPRLTAAFEAIDDYSRSDDLIPVSFQPETLRRLRQDSQVRKYNKLLINALSTAASISLLRPFKQIVKKRLAENMCRSKLRITVFSSKTRSNLVT